MYEANPACDQCVLGTARVMVAELDVWEGNHVDEAEGRGIRAEAGGTADFHATNTGGNPSVYDACEKHRDGCSARNGHDRKVSHSQGPGLQPGRPVRGR